MRGPALAVAALAASLALSIALFGHKPTYPPETLQPRCENTNPEYNRDRIRACKALLRRYVFAPWYRGAINSQLCAALAKAGSWQKAIEVCTEANDPQPWYSNYVNRAAAYKMLGESKKAADDLVQAQIERHRQD